MADKTFKVNEAIKIKYQGTGRASGLTVVMDVYDELDVKDIVQSGSMIEIGSTGVYGGAFTPDAEGQWHIQIVDSDGGKAIKAYSVGIYNLTDVGANIASTEAKVDAIDIAMAKDATVAKDSTVAKDLTVAKAAAVATVDGKVDALDIKIDTLSGKIDTIESPPMVG